MKKINKEKKIMLLLLGMGICISIAFFPLFAGDFAHSNPDEITILDQKAAEDVAVSFVQNCLSDGASEEDPAPYLAKDADALRELVAIRKTIRANGTIKGCHLIDFTVQNKELTNIGRGCLDILLDTMEYQATYPSNEINVSRQNLYRLILVKEGEQWKVQKAIADDYSGSCTHPNIICDIKAFKDYNMNNYASDIQDLDITNILQGVQETRTFFQQAQADYDTHKDEIEQANEERDRLAV